ncbi:MAG: 50S ribosomal protein L9 [Chlamydiota bacterium]
MGNQLLLIEDVDDLGRSGDVVTVKPGYARNFLLPQKKAVVADRYTLRLQARLKEERAKLAEIDKKDAEILADKVNEKVLEITVKVDPEGHMYGSVSAIDIVRLFEESEGIALEKRNVLIAQPIKALGDHVIQLKLKEGVPAKFTLRVNSDIPLPKRSEPAVKAEPVQEEYTDDNE